MSEVQHPQPAPISEDKRKESTTQNDAALDTPTKLALGAKKIEETIDKAKFPLLTKKLGVSLSTDFDVKAIIREINDLADVVESVNLREFQAWNGRRRSWLVIPRSSTLGTFQDQARRNNLVNVLASSLVPMEDDNTQLMNLMMMLMN